MKCIVIEGITMPPTKSLAVGGEMVEKSVTMASGKTIKWVVGYRAKLKAEWNWLPQDTITKIHRLIRQGGFFNVQYPDPDKGDTSALFEITMPESGVFKFTGNAPRWKDVSLEFTAQEVT